MMLSRRSTLAGLSASLISAPALARSRFDARVIVLGAGIAGLETALRLEAAGVDVLIVEAQNRIGGRLNTLNHLPGQPNAGGVQVGGGYRRLRARAATLPVEFFPEPVGQRPSFLQIGADKIKTADWASSPHNHFPEAYRTQLPAGVLFGAAGRNNPLRTADDWRSAAGVARGDAES